MVIIVSFIESNNATEHALFCHCANNTNCCGPWNVQEACWRLYSSDLAWTNHNCSLQLAGSALSLDSMNFVD